jgi:hypothetical protein
MPKVTYVKSARERRNSDSTTKPLLTCDACQKAIEVGHSYKHLSIKTGAYSSRKLVRCDACPTWQVWEYSNSTSARTAQISHEARTALESAETVDEVTDALQAAADAVRELAEEKREGAQNIEEGFGHPTTQSDELTCLADELDSWADALEQAAVPDFPDPEDAECEGCEGKGHLASRPDCLPEGTDTCPDCKGTGHPEGLGPIGLAEWREEVANMPELDDSPV